MIPKQIYYVWLGKPKPQKVLDCIESWKREMPDYTITELNESTFDLDQYPFIKLMLKKKNYAYASDMIRLLWLKDHPGIYLDTDMYFLRSIPEEHLSNDFFVARENSLTPNCGIIGVANPDDIIINEFLSYYNDYSDTKVPLTNVIVLREILQRKYSLHYLKGHKILVGDPTYKVAIYSPTTYYPISWDHDKKPDVTKNTVAIHQWESSAIKEGSKRKAKANAACELAYPEVFRQFGVSSLSELSNKIKELNNG